MNKALPDIIERANDLKTMMRQERDRRKQRRLQMVYLLASQHATNRKEVAQLLGVDRNTVGRWLACYEAGGLPALLDVYVPRGKAPSLAPEVIASIQQALHRPEGFTSYEALRQWVEQTHHVTIKYKTLYTLIHDKLKARLKVPRPSHIKKRLRLRQSFAPRVANDCAQQSPPTMSNPSRSLRRMKAALGC